MSEIEKPLIAAQADAFLAGYYGKMPFLEYTLLDRAVRTLEGNVRSRNMPWAPRRGIIPSGECFRGVWNWDCAFHALGTRRWDMDLARDQVRIFLGLQRASGLFPDVQFDDGRIVDFFGKPPVFPYVTAILEAQCPDAEFRKQAVDGFIRNERFWRERRGGDRYGMFFYGSDDPDSGKHLQQACFESGWDNAVRWDKGISNLFPVDLNCYMVWFYRALYELTSDSVWRERARALASDIENTLWNDKDGCYEDYCYSEKRFTHVITPASFMPLTVGIASPERAERMEKIAREHFMPLWPSVSYRDRNFDPTGYWRGRTWLNIGFFALKGLRRYQFHAVAEAGRTALLQMVSRHPGAIFENYNPCTGEPEGCAHFGWSAAFVIEFLLGWDSSEEKREAK